MTEKYQPSYTPVTSFQLDEYSEYSVTCFSCGSESRRDGNEEIAAKQATGEGFTVLDGRDTVFCSKCAVQQEAANA